MFVIIFKVIGGTVRTGDILRKQFSEGVAEAL
jgi:hypothetical protein